MSTAIEWTDETWNPVRGCRRVSAGCENCYAELIAARFSGPGQAFEGLARMRRVPGADGVAHGVPQWTGNSAVVESRMLDPLRWQRPRRVFVNSMSDLFYEQFDDETIARVFAVMRDAPRHVFQVLTKRPERMLEWVAGPGYELTREAETRLPSRYSILQSGREWTWPLPNVWLGVSVENQEAADERIPLLVKTPAATRFLSCEPLLGPVDLTVIGDPDSFYRLDALTGEERYPGSVRTGILPPLDWVIVGGESGAKARPCDVEWITLIVADCDLNGVPCFVKQLGALPIREGLTHWYGAKGESIGDWPERLRVRQFPGEAVPA
jgi:protein gp37